MSQTNLPSRTVLLEAGKRLALEQGSAVQMSMEAVMQIANIPEPLFHTYFSDRRRYLLALLQHLLDEARAEVLAAISKEPQSATRVRTAFDMYLDANLRRRPLRELANHFRTDAEGHEMLRARAHGVALITEIELKTAGWPHAQACARLLTAMVLETASAEFEAGKKLAPMREALYAYLKVPFPPGFASLA